MKLSKPGFLRVFGALTILSFLSLTALGQALGGTNSQIFTGDIALVAIDTSVTPHRLYVSDNGNNRVLGYRDVTSLTMGQAADLVIGQVNFTTGSCNQGAANPSASTLCDPRGMAVDASGNLYVADRANNRVLEYNTPFASCAAFPCALNQAANVVFGQAGSFTSAVANNGGESANSLDAPRGVAVDAGANVYVSDFGSNRVLEYDTPLTKDTTADMVFGQCGSFTSSVNTCPPLSKHFGPLSADTLNGPVGVAVDLSTGNLYVGDSGNNRVLEYNDPVSTRSTTANVVFGQDGCFSCNASNNGGLSANSLDLPRGVAVDDAGNVYIADYGNNRLLEYNTPLTSGTTADQVFGQAGSFTSNAGVACGSAYSLCSASGVAVDSNGDVFAGNAPPAIFEYYTPISSIPVANVVLGQAGFAPTPIPTATPTRTPTATPTPKHGGK